MPDIDIPPKFEQESHHLIFLKELERLKKRNNLESSWKSWSNFIPTYHWLRQIKKCQTFPKFMKDFLTKRKRLGYFSIVALTQDFNQLFQGKLLPKLKDPGSSIIPCKIRYSFCGRALCDVRASNNLMPVSIFKKICI